MYTARMRARSFSFALLGRLDRLARSGALVALTFAGPVAFAACGDSGAGATPAGGVAGDPGTDGGEVVGDGGKAASAIDGGGDGGKGKGTDAGGKPDASAGDGPATPNGKMDALCQFTADPQQRTDLLVVDPSGTHIVYPRLAPGTTNGEIVLRDLTTNKVTKLGDMGPCDGVQFAGSVSTLYSATTQVSWIQKTASGLLYADKDSALHLTDFAGVEKAHLAITGHAWKRGEVTVVGTGPDAIRAAMVKLVGGVPRLVTYTSDAGAGSSVESADLSPTFAANANVETAVSADGSYAAAIVAFKTLYAAPTTASATAKVMLLSDAGFRPERTAKGALVSDLTNSSDTWPHLREVDFTTATDLVTPGIPTAVTATQVASGIYTTEFTSNAMSVTQLATWRFTPGAGRTDIASVSTASANPSTFLAATTPDESNYVMSVLGTGLNVNYSLLYSAPIGGGATTYRPARQVFEWAVGGNAVLATRETSYKLRFEDLAPGAKAATEITLPAADVNGRLRVLSRNGHVGFLELSVYDSNAHHFNTGFDTLSDTGVHTTLRALDPVSNIDQQAAWDDGIVLVLEDGFYFYR